MPITYCMYYVLLRQEQINAGGIGKYQLQPTKVLITSVTKILNLIIPTKKLK